MRVLRFLSLLILLAAPPAMAQDAAAFVQNLGNKTLEVINKKPAPAERDKQFRSILHEGFDMLSISRSVLGRNHWGSASDAQKQEFVKLFEDYIVTAYGARFADYTGEGFKVTGQRQEGDTRVVTSQIVRPQGGAPVRVDWRVEKGKIIDVVVEGISLITTQRQEFASVIQRNGGLDGLLKLLREKTRA